MLSDSQVGVIIKNEVEAALAYEGELSRKRAKLMDYYNAQPYGDEVDGQSSVVTTDVSDVIEWMLPSLLRIFTQGKNIATFSGNTEADDQEAKEKTFLSNYLFTQEHKGTLILHNMFKDALLQYTGWVKVFWDDREDTKIEQWEHLSELERQKLLLNDRLEVTSEEVVEEDGQTFFNIETKEIIKARGVCYANIPPEEGLISKNSRTFEDPVFIGHRSPKTRSDLIQMGFNRDIVNNLPADEYFEDSEEKNARYHDLNRTNNPSNHHPNDVIYLGEYYMRLDVNEDGVTELWQVMYAGQRVLSKEPVDEHPFAVCIPVPIPHRAIGSCPAEQTADLQFRKSTLVRQMLNNVYQTNYPRILHSNKVELDDLMTPRAGGLVGIDSDSPDVAGHAQMLGITPMVEGMLAAIEYTDTEREVRTGMTRYSQGMDAESLNKTATGFLGIKDASQQRMELIARLFADGGVRDIFEKTVRLLSKYQKDPLVFDVMGEDMEISPRIWGDNTRCRIDVGLGSGDRQEKILNLNAVLQRQLEFKQMGMVIVDQEKIYNTMDKLVTEVGLKDVDVYFNNPQVPEETLFAQNEQLTQMVMQMQEQLQSNPLAEAELVRAQAKMLEVQSKESNSMNQFMMKMQADMQKFTAEMAAKLTELELKYDQDVPGALTGEPDQLEQAERVAKIRKMNAETEAQQVETELVRRGAIDAQTGEG